MTDWQPIETAPKDGTQIIGYGIWQGEINGIDNPPEPSIDIISGPPGKSDHDSGFDWWPCTTGDAYATWLKATHWMPLPEPPND